VPSIPPPSLEQAEQPPRPATSHAPQRRSGAAAWAPWTSIAALFAGLVATVLGSAIVAIASGTSDQLDDPPPGVNIALTLFQNLALFGAAVGFAFLVRRPSAADFGLRRPLQIRRAIGLLAAVWAGFYALSALWVSALGLHETQELPDRLGADGSTLNVLAVVVLITVIAPLGEEIFFRGYFFGSLRNWRGFWPAAIGTGLIFGAIHAGSAPVGFLVPLGIFGFGLCLLYERTGSLYPCIALHALNNSIALGAALHWSWQIPAMMVGSTILALLLASRLALLLGSGPEPAVAAPAPARS
jgi:membrane protease YdiL (CAAX protease family)